jgi:hypothetical protein
MYATCLIVFFRLAAASNVNAAFIMTSYFFFSFPFGALWHPRVLHVGSRTWDRAKMGPGRVKKIADLMIFNQSKGNSGSYAHAARVGMKNHPKSRSLLHLTSLK